MVRSTQPKLLSSSQPARTYARGEAARARIMEAAIETFGELGFEQATMRLIAQRAKVNLGALQYYFGGKESLYLGCAEHIAAYAETSILAFFPAGAAEPREREGVSQAEHFEALCGLWDSAADRILAAGKATGWMMFIGREQMAPGKAFDILYERVIARLVGLFASRLGRVMGKAPDSEEVKLQAIALLGPLFIFQRARGMVLKVLDWRDLEGAELARAKRVIRRQSLFGIGAPPEARLHTRET